MIAPPFTPEPGQFYDGLDNEAYHAGPGYSSSQLKLFADWSPRFFKESQELERTETPAMVRGSLIHAMVLEPETVESRYHFSTVKKSGKDWPEKWAAVEAEAAGRQIIREDPAPMWALANAVREHKAWTALAGSEPICERSFYWTDKLSGLLLKCRTDALRLDIRGGRARITDLKTCQDPRPHAFTRQVKSLGYDFSAAMYCAGVEAVLTATMGREISCQYLWIAVRSNAPHAVAVYDAAPWLPQASATYHRTLQALAECERSEVWPDLHGERVVPLERPAWAQASGDDDE